MMTKEEFCWILESALLHFDGILLDELKDAGIQGKYAKAGIRLCELLQQQDI